MANEQQLSVLRQGTAVWNAWYQDNADSVTRPDLHGADLHEAHLDGANLARADLGGANLERAHLREANFQQAELMGACLNAADLTRANLGGTNLIDAVLRETELRGSNLSMANLYMADLEGADLESADLSRARAVRAALIGCNVRSAVLIEIDLTMADLRQADLTGAVLHAAKLHFAVLQDADLSQANLAFASLSHTVFGNTHLRDVEGLDSCVHEGPSTLDFQTLQRSRSLSLVFMRRCGLSEWVIKSLPPLLDQPIEPGYYISYSQADGSFALHLYDELQRRGIRCWLDDHRRRPGQDVHERVRHDSKLRNMTLLCCSKHALTSWWFDQEIQTALKRERELTQKHGSRMPSLIPLDLDGYLLSGQCARSVKEQIKTYSVADFTGCENDTARFAVQFERLVSALRAQGCET